VSQATGQPVKTDKSKKKKKTAAADGAASSASANNPDSKETQPAAAAAEGEGEGNVASANDEEEEEDKHEGEVWDAEEQCWVPSEEAAKKEVAKAQEWAEDLTRDHLMWYLEEFPSSTYEDWVAAFAPENARE